MRIISLVAALTTLQSPLSAQRDRGESRLSLGMTVGATTGTSLWRVPSQPLMDNGGILDTISLSRSIGASVSAAVNLIWFPHTNLGLGGELMMMGGSFGTQCSLRSSARTARNQSICTSITRASTTSKAVSVSGGVFYRLHGRSSFSPYVSGRLGVAISQGSTLVVEAFPNGNYGGYSQVILFSDPAPRHLAPMMMLGLGFTTGVTSGYRLRWEIRNQVNGFERAIGATSGRPNQTPRHDLVYEHRLSLLFGGEIMLNRPKDSR